MAKEYFEEWFPAAMKRFEIAKFDIEKGFLKDAAFDLHQTVERLYHCLLLVLTLYTSHTHNIAFLRSQGDRLDYRLVDVWPRDTKRQRGWFEKLKDAYVKARYSKHYRISEEELTWLGARVEALGAAVHEVCQERLEALKGRAG